MASSEGVVTPLRNDDSKDAAQRFARVLTGSDVLSETTENESGVADASVTGKAKAYAEFRGGAAVFDATLRSVCDSLLRRDRVDEGMRKLEDAGRITPLFIGTLRQALSNEISEFKSRRAKGELAALTSAEFVRRVQDLERTKGVLMRRLRYRKSGFVERQEIHCHA
jgi:hypothetical protein